MGAGGCRMPNWRNARYITRFSIVTSVAAVVVMAGTYLLFSLQAGRHVRDDVTAAAHARIAWIERTHRWLAVNARRLGLAAGDGATNSPHTLIREIAALGNVDGEPMCRLLSPPGAAGVRLDEFELAGFQSLAAGQSSYHLLAGNGDSETYRLMRPMAVEPACLECRAGDAYELSNIRGAWVIDTPMAAANARIGAASWTGGIVASIGLAGLLGVVWLAERRVRRALAAAEADLMALASTDPLTGLLNRRALFQELKDELARSRRFSSPMSCIIVDLDHFKRLNDEHGHLAGDRVLREVARVVQATCREYDAVGRYGGEEFLVLAPDTHSPGAMSLAERIRSELDDTPIRYNGTSVRVTASFGVAATQMGDSDRIDEIIGRADRALYQAKDRGRNRVAVLD